MAKEMTLAHAAEAAADKLGALMGYGGKGLMEQMSLVASKIKPETMVRAALTAVTRTPKLKNCTKESFFRSFMDLTALGLTPDGRNAHLIPYGDQCQLIVDYKGLVRIAKRDGDIANVYAELVCENDIFEYNMGKVTKHIIDFRNDRGKPFAVYSHATFKNGLEGYEVMQAKDVMAIKKRSKAASSGPWVTDEYEMWKKTVIRRHSKLWNLQDDVADLLETDFDSMPPLRETIATDAEPADKEGGSVAKGAVRAEDLFPDAEEAESEPVEPKKSKKGKGSAGREKAYNAFMASPLRTGIDDSNDWDKLINDVFPGRPESDYTDGDWDKIRRWADAIVPDEAE